MLTKREGLDGEDLHSYLHVRVTLALHACFGHGHASVKYGKQPFSAVRMWDGILLLQCKNQQPTATSPGSRQQAHLSVKLMEV